MLAIVVTVFSIVLFDKLSFRLQFHLLKKIIFSRNTVFDLAIFKINFTWHIQTFNQWFHRNIEETAQKMFLSLQLFKVMCI